MRQQLRLVLVAWLVAGAAVTASLARVWSSEARVWEAASAASPGKLRPLVNLRILAHGRGDARAAEGYFRQVLARAPSRPAAEAREGALVARLNLILLAHEAGHLEEARRQFSLVLDTEPKFIDQPRLRALLWP